MTFEMASLRLKEFIAYGEMNLLFIVRLTGTDRL
jgi:hypothetical protein